jgi:hypothetical protein
MSFSAPTLAPRPERRPLLLATLALVALGASGCDQPRAHGDEHAVVVGMSPELWDAMELEIENSVAPTIQVVRTERTFRVTHQDPQDATDWGNLRRFRNMVVAGAESDPWIADVLAARRGDAPPVTPPALIRVDNVWARGQTVSAVILPSTDDADGLREMLPQLATHLDEQYRAFARSRMFVSGVDTMLADSLGRNVGFRLTLPRVYRYSVQDDVFRFRNDNPSPSELIREIGLTWVSPIPEELPGREELQSWRASFAAAHYADAQVLDTTLVSLREVEHGGARGVEFQAAWASPPDAWPAGGPFLTRAVACPEQNRLYFLDAWLYAPARSKYEYLIQLETILDSFECARAEQVASGA